MFIGAEGLLQDLMLQSHLGCFNTLNLLFKGLKSLFPLFQVVPMTTWLKVEKWNLCVSRERGTSPRSSSLFSGTVITANIALKGLPDDGPEPKRSRLKDCWKMCFYLGSNTLSNTELQKSHWSDTLLHESAEVEHRHTYRINEVGSKSYFQAEEVKKN